MTEVNVVTPETLTFETIKQWDGATMKRYMQVPSMREAIYRVVQTQPLAVVEAVAAAQVETPPAPVVDEAAVAEAARVAEEQRVAEAARVAAEVEANKNKKFVLEYQVKDEEGNPLGRPTHLEAASQEDLIEKMKEAHTQATRAFHRLKKQKVQSLKEVNNQPVVSEVPTALSDAEMLVAIRDLKSDDPQKALEAHRKLNQAEVNKAKAEANAKLAATEELRRQEQVSYTFLRAHQNDFNNCEANVNLIKDYFTENQLPWTSDNLEIAFHALESELAPVVVPVVATPPANPATVAPAAKAATTPAVPVVVQPVVTAPVITTPPANPATAQPRPGVNGGIVPGQASAPRPATGPTGVTIEEIRSWDGPTMRTKMRNPQIRAQIEKALADHQNRK